MGEVPKGGRWEWTDWGVPTWEHPEYYENAHWDSNQWRWEFLRRRQDYREVFEKALAELLDPLATPEDYADVEHFLIGDGMRAWPFHHKDAERFRLEELYDPVISEWMGCGPEWNSGLIHSGLNGRDYRWRGPKDGWREVDAPHLVSVTFDLRFPLAAQFAEARDYIEDMQFQSLVYAEIEAEDWDEDVAIADAKKRIASPKFHQSKWPLYLRVLDARAAGASLAQIAEILPDTMSRQDPQSARNVLTQAERQQFSF